LLARNVLPMRIMAAITVIRQGNCAQGIGNDLGLEDAQRFGERHVTRNMTGRKIRLPYLFESQTSPQKKRSLHAPPPTKHENQNQTEDPPRAVVQPLSATQILDQFQNHIQLHRPDLKKNKGPTESHKFAPDQ
jgi:hypothetical protein